MLGLKWPVAIFIKLDTKVTGVTEALKAVRVNPEADKHRRIAAMDKISLEVSKSYRDKDGNTLTITNICVEVAATGEIETVLVVHVNDEFCWLRLPADNDTITTWRKT